VATTVAHPERLGAAEAAAAIRDGRLSSEALVRACLERLAAREPEVHAWVHVDPAECLRRARDLDRIPRMGPLHGVPIGVKDVFDTFGMPTRYGSRIYEDHRPSADAECVANCRRQGMIVLGKTVTTELAARHPGPTANPHNLAHTPGGSSSGSAAAVADFMVPLALGTQTAGSLIRPAAYCGVIGYKPTFGEISRAGVKLQSETLDTVGLMARSLDDLPLWRAILLAAAPVPLARADRAPRIGFCRALPWEPREAETQQLLERRSTVLSARGAKVTDVTLPAELADSLTMQRRIMAVESSRNYAPERTHHRDKLSAALLEALANGEACTRDDYLAALVLSARLRAYLDDLLTQHVDLLLTASVVGEAPQGLAWTGDTQCNAVWTLAGTPCITLPAGTGRHGLPLGVQLIGARGTDHRLFSTARWVEERLG